MPPKPNSCTGAFLAAAYQGLSSKYSWGQEVPMMLTWVLGKKACGLVPQENITLIYGCGKSANCTIYGKGGQGYCCECITGHRGNAHLPDRCQGSVSLFHLHTILMLVLQNERKFNIA